EALKSKLGGAVVPVMLDRVVAAQSARAPSKDQGRQDTLNENVKDLESRNLQNLKQKAGNSTGLGAGQGGGRESDVNRSYFGISQGGGQKGREVDESALNRRIISKNAATDQPSNTQGANRSQNRGA